MFIFKSAAPSHFLHLSFSKHFTNWIICCLLTACFSRLFHLLLGILRIHFLLLLLLLLLLHVWILSLEWDWLIWLLNTTAAILPLLIIAGITIILRTNWYIVAWSFTLQISILSLPSLQAWLRRLRSIYIKVLTHVLLHHLAPSTGTKSMWI